MQATKNEVHRCDICIVGAGLVGLTLAQLIVRELPGIRLAIVEKQRLSVVRQGEFNKGFNNRAESETSEKNSEKDRQSSQGLPGFDGRSTALSMGSVEVFAALGMWAQLSKRATAIQSVRVSDKGHFASTQFDRRQNHGSELGYVVENAWLGCNLIEGIPAMDAFSVFAPAEINSVQMHARGATLELDHSPESKANQSVSIDTDLLIIADGLDSRLRCMLGIQLDHKPYYQHAIIANVMFSKAHCGTAYECFTEQGPLALLPLGYQPNARMSALIYTRPDAVVDKTLAQSDAEFLQELQQVFGFRLGQFTRVSKRSAYPLSLSLAREQVRSSMVLMGNAAHFLHPVAGQGFNLALRDVTQLLVTLKRAHARRARGVKQRYGDLRLLQQYLQLQENDQRLTTGLSDQFNTVFSSSGYAHRSIRSVGLLGLQYSQALRRGVFHRMMGASLPKANLKSFRQGHYD